MANPKASLIRAAIGSCGFPAMVGSTPEAVATAANRAPDPGTKPSGVGWTGSSLVPMSRPVRRATVAVAASTSKSNDRVHPTTAATASPA